MNGISNLVRQGLKTNGTHVDPTKEIVDEPIDVMTKKLEDNRLRVSLAFEDRTGVVQHFIQMTSELRLNIDGMIVRRIQEDQTGTFCVITGPNENLERLVERLERDRGRPHVGKQINPSKVFRMRIH